MTQVSSNLVHYNDPILTEEIEEFDFLNTNEDPIEIAQSLAKEMATYGGIGLAANQIGRRVRAFVIASNPMLVMFNPNIIDYSEETVELEEACLSYPNLVVKVNRPKTIKIRFTLPNNVTETKVYTGMTARIIQHELEHLNGKRFFDTVEWYEKEKVKRWLRTRKLQEKQK